MNSVGVIGSGSWATALVKILCENGTTVHWWLRNDEHAKYIREHGHNPNYLRAAELPVDQLVFHNDLDNIVTACDFLILAIPSAFVHDTIGHLSPELFKGKYLFSAVKGMIPEYHAIPARYFHKNFDVPYNQIGMISGPCHAEEVAMERLSYLTIAAQDEYLGQRMCTSLSCRYIHTSFNRDLFGIELSAVLKNVFAVASGICHGLGYGDNFQAVLISNAMVECTHFLEAVSPVPRDVSKSAYLGDLLVTAYSQFSRNRTFGNMLGKGYSVKSAQFEMDMIAEGYYAVKSIFEVNKRFKVDLPITQAVYNIVYEQIAPVIEIRILADKLS